MANWWDTISSIFTSPSYRTPEQSQAFDNILVSPAYRNTTPTTSAQSNVQAQTQGQAPASQVNMQSLIPSNLEAAGRMGGAYGGGQLGLAPPQMPQQGYMGMSDEELLAWILGGSGGGGGVDLSGYNEMLADVASRETGLGTRKEEQEAFLADLFGAGQTRLESDQEALAAAIEDALASDQARREAEIGLIRGDEAARLATADQAREALGVEGGADLSSDIAQNAVAGVGAGGSVSERDARIRESIQNQQIQSQIAGLIPMEQMATTSLGRNYEDRLSALASERAAIQAQMAGARAAGGSRGPSVSERLAALGFVDQLNAPAAAPQFDGALGSAQEIQQAFGPLANDVLGIANQILTSARTSYLDPTSLAGASELLTELAASDPNIASFLRNNQRAAGAIINYVVQTGK